MERISKVTKCTDNPFLNYYELSVVHKGGNTGRYFMASRAKSEEKLKDGKEASSLFSFSEKDGRSGRSRETKSPSTSIPIKTHGRMTL